MTSIHEAGLGAQIVANAYLALLLVALTLMAGAPILRRVATGAGKVPNPIEAVVGVGIIIGLPAAFAAAPAMLVTPLLLAMPLPLAGWGLIAMLALFGLATVDRNASGDTAGCRAIMLMGLSGFGLAWAVTAIVMADPPAGDAASFARPLLVAMPVALLFGTASRGRKWRQSVATLLFVAVFAAIAFLPVERGFGSGWLPASDWLRFPVMGGIVFGVWPILAIPLALVFGHRAIRFGRHAKATLVMAAVGGLFGLAWAATRLLF